jgi:hypothetical protein
MKKITTEANEGYLHIIGEFGYVRKKYGDQVVHEPRWTINLFRTESSAKPMPHAIEDDRIEMWNTRILIAQDGGFMFYANTDEPMQQDFHLVTLLPIVEPIYVFYTVGDPATITGKEEQE